MRKGLTHIADLLIGDFVIVKTHHNFKKGPWKIIRYNNEICYDWVGTAAWRTNHYVAELVAKPKITTEFDLYMNCSQFEYFIDNKILQLCT